MYLVLLVPCHAANHSGKCVKVDRQRLLLPLNSRNLASRNLASRSLPCLGQQFHQLQRLGLQRRVHWAEVLGRSNKLATRKGGRSKMENAKKCVPRLTHKQESSIILLVHLARTRVRLHFPLVAFE